MAYNGVNGIWYTQNIHMIWWLVGGGVVAKCCWSRGCLREAPHCSEICGYGLCGLRLKRVCRFDL